MHVDFYLPASGACLHLVIQTIYVYTCRYREHDGGVHYAVVHLKRDNNKVSTVS